MQIVLTSWIVLGLGPTKFLLKRGNIITVRENGSETRYRRRLDPASCGCRIQDSQSAKRDAMIDVDGELDRTYSPQRLLVQSIPEQVGCLETLVHVPSHRIR
jgi:hypothetical protein